MEPNDEYTPIDTPIQRIDEDRLFDILGDLIAEAAAPMFDEAFKAKEAEIMLEWQEVTAMSSILVMLLMDESDGTE